MMTPCDLPSPSGAMQDAEFRRFLHIAMGSAAEADYHLLMARDTGCLDALTYEKLSANSLEIRRMIGGLIKRLNTDTRPKRSAAGAAGQKENT